MGGADVLSEDPNTGGVVLEVERRFARADAERRAELDRLIKAGKGDQEVRVAKAKVGERICSSCNKAPLGGNNRSGVCTPCQKSGTGKKAPRPAAKVARVAAPKPAALLDLMDREELAGASTRDLLALREALDDELRGRLSLHESELAALRAAVGGRAA